MYGNNITNVDLTGYTKLIEVSLSINPIDSVAFSNLPSIVIFRCHTTNITTLNASLFGNTLKTLVIDNNRFTLPTLKTILGQLVGKMTNGLGTFSFLPNTPVLNTLLTPTTATNYGINLTSNIVILANTNFTIEFSIYLKDLQTQHILVNSSGSSRVFISNARVSIQSETSVPFNINFLSNCVLHTFYTIKLQSVGNTVTLYRNNTLQNSTTFADALTFNSIGKKRGTGTIVIAFVSWLCSMYVNNNGIENRWTLDETSGNIAYDSIGTNHGTIETAAGTVTRVPTARGELNEVIVQLQLSGNSIAFIPPITL